MASKRPIEIVLNSEYNNKDINRAINDLNALKRQAGGTAPAMNGLGKAIVGMAAGFVGMQGLIKIKDFLIDAAKAAMEDETSVKRLETAMRNLNMVASIPNIERGIDAMSRQYGIADDQLRPAMQKLLQATGDVDTAQAAMSTAMDVSAGTGRDLSTVTTALSRAYAGNTAGLSRLGVPLDKTLLASKDMVAIQKELNRVFGGQASAAAHTYAGQMAKMNIAIDEAKEAIGYALLRAIENMSNALGGTGGATAAIDELGQAAAGLVTEAGYAVTGVANVGKAVMSLGQDTRQSLTPLLDFADLISHLDPTGISAVMTTLARKGIEANQATEAINDSLRASEGYMQSYVASIDPASAKLQQLKFDTEDAAASQAELAAALDDVKAGLSLWAAIDAYNAKLREIRTLSDDGSRALDGHGKAAMKNTEMIRSAFDAAANRVSLWAKEVGAQEPEITAKFQKLSTKIRDTLIAAGFDEGDIDRLLGKYNLWDAKAAGILDAVQSGAKNAKNAGQGIGRDFVKGVGAGIALEQAALDFEARRMVFSAEKAARNAAESNSPSKLMARLGKDLVKGTIKGVKDEIQNRRDELKSTYQAWFNDSMGKLESVVEGFNKDLAKATDDKEAAQKAKDNFENLTVVPLRNALKQAQDEMASYKSSVQSSLVGAINFRDLQPTAETTDKDGNTTAATKFIDNLKAKAEQAKAFAVKVKQLITMGLSQAGIAQVLSAGADAGGAIADELIAGGVTAISTTNDLMTAVSTAATTTADTAGATFYQAGVDLAASQLAGAESQLNGYYQLGVDNAQAVIDGLNSKAAEAQAAMDLFNATYGPDSKGFGKYFDQAPTFAEVTESIGDFKDFKKDAGKLIKKKKKAKGKASGGAVSPNEAYFIGEEGPELFVPSTAGSIIPAGAGGNTYKITVQTGVGDPRQIGQSVVEYIKRFEKANGPVFAKAG